LWTAHLPECRDRLGDAVGQTDVTSLTRLQLACWLDAVLAEERERHRPCGFGQRCQETIAEPFPGMRFVACDRASMKWTCQDLWRKGGTQRFVKLQVACCAAAAFGGVVIQPEVHVVKSHQFGRGVRRHTGSHIRRPCLRSCCLHSRRSAQAFGPMKLRKFGGR
jgi:hypothetical protein